MTQQLSFLTGWKPHTGFSAFEFLQQTAEMGLKFTIFLLAVLCLASGQSNICYANCKRGFCQPTNALSCTDCDLGLVNINNMCIGGNSQAAPVTYLKPSLRGLADSQTQLNCSVRSAIGTTQMFFQRTIGITFTRSFQLPSGHIYIQLKFNAIISAVGSAPPSPTLLLTVFTTAGQTIYTTVKSFNTSGNQVTCSSNYQAFDVFYSNQKFASSESSILVELRASGLTNAKVAVSGFQIYYGNCSQQCALCFGPTNQECLSCRGLLAVLSNNKCMNCSEGFYQSSEQGLCLLCPVQCKSCSLTNGQIKCGSCNSDIASSVDPSISSLGCRTNYSKTTEAADQNFENSSWVSSETSGNSVTECGYYSLIGGVTIGVAGSSLKRVFTKLPAHTTIYIYFTMFLIDQALGDFNGFAISVDGQKKSSSFAIAPPVGATLTNECGTSALQFAFRQSFQFVHKDSSATVIISFLKDYAGIRDFSIIANNQTNVANCYSEFNSTCTACRNGFALINNTCNNCSDGYYRTQDGCSICPITCKTCDASSRQPVCLSCQPPLVLDGIYCIDNSQSLFTSDVLEGISSPPKAWSLYPRLQNNGITSCNGNTILGSSDIKFKFLKMKRTFTGLPSHTGVAIAFQFYQIDDYANDQSVKFILNNVTTIYKPSNLKMELCGNYSPDAVVPIYLTDTTHSASTLDFQISIDRMGKLGISNLMIYLLNGGSGAAIFTIDAVPTYSISTPPIKGITVRLLFPQSFKIKNKTDSAFSFVIKSASSRLLQETFGTVVFAQNSSTNGNKQILYLINAQKDQANSQLQVRANSPSNIYFTDSNGNTDLISQQLVTATLPRYVDMDTASVSDRSSCRSLYNLFRSCAILGLFFGIASFLVGMSAAFDDFLLLCQLIFVHVFIQLDYNPPSVRIPFDGLHIVQFLEWLPWEARQSIEKFIIPDDLYQQSPLVYTQYYHDIVFARTVYQPLLYIAVIAVFWIILRVTLDVWQSKNLDVKYHHYFLYYYNRYDEKELSFVDKIVRFAYFSIVWACVLQFTHLSNQPKSFNIWNSVITFFFFLAALAYPVIIFLILRKRAQTVSAGTFHKKYQEVRVDPEKLYYFLIRYYKLVLIACIIGFLYAASPVIPIIVLIALNLADAILLIFLRPLGMVQPQLIEATTFYPNYPSVYHKTAIIQQGLFILMEFLLLVLYGQRKNSSTSSYMGIGYAICAVVILLLLNGLFRLFWGFMKQAQHCYLQRETLEQSIEKEIEDNKDPAQQNPIMENVLKSQMNISKRDLSKLVSRKMSHISKIR